jgi:hypothetical protein
MGFDERLSQRWYFDGQLQDEVLVLNTAEYLREPKAAVHFREDLCSALNAMGSGAQVVTSFQPIGADIRDSVERGHRVGPQGYHLLRQLLEVLVLTSRSLDSPVISYVPGDEPPFQWASSTGEPIGLYGRVGNVELRVLDSFLTSRNEFFDSCDAVRLRSLSREDLRVPRTRGSGWLSSQDVEFNVRLLLTNAGFYFADGEDSSIRLWCDRYFEALRTSTALFPYPNANPFFFIVQEELANRGPLPPYVRFPAMKDFYRLMADRTVVFVTPFADLVRHQVASGRVRKLFAGIEVPEFEIETIQSPMSIYPNRPDESWNDSFLRTVAQIDAKLASCESAIFIASAGCYGMPLAAHASRHHRVPSLYYGNAVHGYFGIRQNGTAGLGAGNRIEGNWVDGNLSKVPGVAHVDGGRYI